MNSIRTLGLAAALMSSTSLAMAQSVDLVFLVDESGSMAGEQVFIGDIAPTIESAIQAGGTPNVNFSLIGFGNGNGTDNDGRIVPVGGSTFGNATEFDAATDTLLLSGFLEDGYAAIDFALANVVTPGNATTFVLISDEDRDDTNAALTFGSIESALAANDIALISIVQVDITSDQGTAAIATDGTQAIISDGTGGTFAEGIDVATGIDSFAGTTEADYVDLALATNGGCVADLDFLRAGGLDAQSFAAVFETCITAAVAVVVTPGGVTTFPINQFRDLARVISSTHRGAVRQIVFYTEDAHLAEMMSTQGMSVIDNALGFEKMRLFGVATGMRGDYDYGAGNNADIDYSGGGFIVGADFTSAVSGGMARGSLSFGFDRVTGDMPETMGMVETSSYTLHGTYGYYEDTGWYVLADLQFGYHDFENMRMTGGGTATATPDVRAFTGELEAGYRMEMAGGPISAVTPFFGLGFGNYDVNTYVEDTGTELEDWTNTVGYGILGVRGEAATPVTAGDLYAAFELAGRISFDDSDDVVDLVGGGGAAVVDGVSDDEIAVTIELGLDLDTDSKIFARYDGGFSDVIEQHAINVGFRHAF
ncbi:MAG: autotransporter domain-containing protein [Pseudomonadota bacterium]